MKLLFQTGTIHLKVDSRFRLVDLRGQLEEPSCGVAAISNVFRCRDLIDYGATDGEWKVGQLSETP